MATFVHLTAEANVSRIRRNGIARNRTSVPGCRRGVFANPVTRSFYASHQWLREVKRGRGGAIAAVYFRIADEERLWLGHYGKSHREMSAADAAATFEAAESNEGWEVIVPRRIEAAEITKTKSLPQVIGWRYFPGAHGQKPCPCPYCSAGTFGAKRIRSRLGGDP